MVATTYLATAAFDQLDHAQTVIDEHVAACVGCGTNQPCFERREAEAVFARYQRPPRRTPGLTVATSSEGRKFGWFSR